MVGSTDVERHLRTIFRRCVKCPPGSPSCPVCPADETCSLQAESCFECASTTCVKITSLPGQATPRQRTPVGAIAGGVIGGVAVIIFFTYLIYRYINGKKRRENQAWMDQKVEKRDLSTLHLADRQSTRSVGSIATTFLSRASNIIPIAYIPGVINRTPPESPSLLTPPVPPIPAASATSSSTSTPQFEQDMHFFMPGDLRDSTYSDMTEGQRLSLTPSLARASVATTLYRNNAIVSPVPAQQAFMAKPAVISVKSGHSSPGSSTTKSKTPPMPHLPKHAATGGSSVVARSLTPRPIEVRKVNSAARVPTLANLARANSNKTGTTTSTSTETIPMTYWEEKEVVHSPTLGVESPPAIVSPMVRQQASHSSFQTAASQQSPGSPLREITSVRNSEATENLNAMIEEAMNRAARDLTHTGLGSRSDLNLRKQHASPFSDANEVTDKENMP